MPWPILAGIGAAASDHGRRSPYGEPPTEFAPVEPPIEGAGNGPMLLKSKFDGVQSPGESISTAAAIVEEGLSNVPEGIRTEMINDPFTKENHERWVKVLTDLPFAWEDMKGAIACAPDTAPANEPTFAGAAAVNGTSATGVVGGSMYGGPDRNGDKKPDGGDDNGISAYGGSMYNGHASWAELSTNPKARPLDFAAIGDLPQNSALKITSPETGKSIIAIKRDRGAGGKSVQYNGTTLPKKVDLWWQAAAELGLPGWDKGIWSGPLQIEPAPEGAQPTTYTAVGNDGTPGAGAAPAGDATAVAVPAGSTGPTTCAPAVAASGMAIQGGDAVPLPGGAKPSVQSYPFPEGFVYPLVTQSESFIDSYAAGRSGGRTHNATDMMTPRGTPIVAPENGMVSQVGSNPLGGNRMWVSGKSGYHYYLAHFDGFAPGITDGLEVTAGTLLGWAGNTGSGAQFTPPHLHIALHWPEKSSKPALNPYPLLSQTPQGAAAIARGETKATSGDVARTDASGAPSAELAGSSDGMISALGGGPSAAMNEARALFGLTPIGGVASEEASTGGTVDAQALAAAGGMSIEAATAYIEGAERARVLVPSCAVDPLFLAGFGKIESGHGTANGAKIMPNGMVEPKIMGPPLDGSGVGGNTTAMTNKLSAAERPIYGVTGQYDQAVGPMQFLASTFKGLQPAPTFKDGQTTPPTPHSYSDATLGAAILLCSEGNGLQDDAGMRKGAYAYNRSSAYVDKVMAEYNRLKAALPAGGTTASNGTYTLPATGIPPAALGKAHHDHPSWDWGTPAGTPVLAITTGVIQNTTNASCGNGVVLNGDDGGEWMYCHGTSHVLTNGQRVKPGDVLLKAGNTGASRGNHIHLQLKVGGTLRCVTDLLPAWGKGQYPPIGTARTKGQAPPVGQGQDGCYY